MSRSVSTHRHAVATVYLQPELHEEDDFDYFLEDLKQNILPAIFPSLRECNRWMDREDHIIMESGRCEVSVSTYCGLVAVCLAPRDPDCGLDCGWCGQQAGKFESQLEKYFAGCALHSMGCASNGEQFFTLASVPGSVVTSKEGRLPMFP
jgi:hypothetical protein